MKHSTIINPNDLHYAKIRTFSGNPSVVTPDFVDQILASCDDDKIYRANGTIAGALMELSASTPSQETSQPKLWTPLANPQFAGQEQSLEAGESYICVANYSDNLQCRLTGDINKQIEVSPTNQRITIRLKSNTDLQIGNTRLTSDLIEGAYGNEYLVLAPMAYFSCVLAINPVFNKQTFYVLKGALNFVDQQTSEASIVNSYSV